MPTRLVQNGHNISGPTSARPTNVQVGQPFFDETLNEPLVWNGTAWQVVGGAGASFSYNAPADTPFFLADRAYRVTGIKLRVLVAGSDAGAVTATIRKAASGTAVASGTALHTGTANLKGTANANQTLTLSSTDADLLLAAGDSLGFDVTGVTTAATGVVTVGLVAE